MKIGPTRDNVDLFDEIQAWRDGLAQAALLDPHAAAELDAALTEARTGKLLSPPPPLLTVMLLGATGGGKSALLNALAGESIATSHHLRPTTTSPTIYLHQDLPPRRLYEYGAELGDLAAQPGTVKTHQRADLRNKAIIDAPDIDSYRTEHRDQVMRLLPLVDVVLYVVTPFSYKDDLGWTVVLKERGRRAFAFVMNKWDADSLPRLQPGEPSPADDFAALVERRAGYAHPRIFHTSARWWAATPDERQALPKPGPGENFDELRHWLEAGLSTSRVEQIQRRRRRSLWGGLGGAVAAAVPPEINAAAARTAALGQTDGLATEGPAYWRTIAERRSEALSRRREEEARPHSMGPFGRLADAVGGVMNLKQSWRKATEPLPDATAEELRAAAGHSEDLVARQVAGLEWRLREMQVPVEGLSSALAGLPGETASRVLRAFERASADLEAKTHQRWRFVTGWIILSLFELLTVGLLGFAAWRLVEAFIAGQYLDLKFTLNLLALVLILLMAGSALMALVFPPVKARIRRELEGALSREWRAAADRAAVAVDEHLDRLEALREKGRALLARTDKEVARLNTELAATTDAETNRVFSGD